MSTVNMLSTFYILHFIVSLYYVFYSQKRQSPLYVDLIKYFVSFQNVFENEARKINK